MHSDLDNLAYETSGHTGFTSSEQLTTTSGDIVAQIPMDYYTTGEVDTISGALHGEITAISGGGTTVHSELSNLDYAYAGHTGFQPAGDYVTDAEMTTISGDIVAQIPSLVGYATEAYVTTVSGDIVAQIPSDFYSQSTVDSLLTTTSGDIVAQIPSDFYSQSQVTTISGDIVAQIPTDYYTQGEVDTISGALNDKIDNIDLSGYATTAQLTTTSGDIITQIPDTSEFLTAAEITTISGDIVSQSPTDFYTQAEVTTISGDIVAQIPSLAGYATEAYVTTVSGDITEYVDEQIATIRTVLPISIDDGGWYGTSRYGKAGHDFSAGDLLHCKYHGDEWLWYKYGTTGTDKVILPIGIATETTTFGNNGVILIDGIMRLDSWGFSPALDSSVTVYASTISGGLTLTVASGAGEMCIIVGMLVGNNTIKTHFGYWYVERV